MTDNHSQPIGSLEPPDFAIIENILMAKKIAAPILTHAHLNDSSRAMVLAFDEITRSTIAAFKAKYSIKNDIRFCFVATVTENAFAAYSPAAPDVYYVVILTGVFLSGKHLQAILENGKTRALLGLPELTPEQPDPHHSSNWGTLSGIAFQWLVLHELGHIKNGHLRLGTQAAFGAVAFEKMERSHAFDRNITMHALEMDADMIASMETIVLLLTTDYSSTTAARVLSSAQSKATAFLLSIYALTRALDAHDWSIERLFHFTHPPALVRVDSIVGWGFEWFPKFPQSEIDHVWWTETFGACALAVEEAISADRAELLKALQYYEGESVEYARKLLGRWAKIRPYLLPHLLGGSLAPAQVDPALPDE